MEMIGHILISLGAVTVIFLMGVIRYIAISAFRLKEPDLKGSWKSALIIALILALLTFGYLRLFHS